MGRKKEKKYFQSNFLCDRFKNIKIMKATMEERERENESLK